METSPPLAQFVVPWGKQEVSLQEVRFEAGGARLLRVRIREGKRFTIFDVDAATALAWAEPMRAWALAQPGAFAVPVHEDSA